VEPVRHRLRERGIVDVRLLLVYLDGWARGLSKKAL
jgi:hypothetical protein